MSARRRELVAIGLMLLWLAAAAGAGRVGIWQSLGSVAVLAGALLLAVDGAALWPRLRPTAAQLLVGAVAGAVMAGLTHALYGPATRLVPAVLPATARLYAAFRSLSPPASALVLLPVVTGEELVWRGLVHATLARRLGPLATVVAGALVYALAHGPVGSLLLVVTALACGLVWGGLRAATGGLVASLVSHLVWDATVLLAFPLAPV
jgi:membrane protease YdiL (CAAX protease family)